MRPWLPTLALFVGAAVVGAGAAVFVTPEEAAASTSTAEPAPDADEVRRWLLGGNALFASGTATPADVDPGRRAAISPSQAPWCTVLTCSDSRVPPEHLFNAGLGRIFTVRVAGNVAEPATIASVEYATEHLHTPLVLVLGHERCGAVKAAMSDASLGANLDTLLGYIRPDIRGMTDLDAAIRTNVDTQLAALRRSRIVTQLEREGKIELVGAIYDLDTGLVTMLDAAAAHGGHAGHGGTADAGTHSVPGAH